MRGTFINGTIILEVWTSLSKKTKQMLNKLKDKRDLRRGQHIYGSKRKKNNKIGVQGRTNKPHFENKTLSKKNYTLRKGNPQLYLPLAHTHL